MLLLLLVGISALTSFLFALGIKAIAETWGIVDHPGSDRKIHRQPIPLLGGIAPFLAIVVVLTGYWLLGERFYLPPLTDTHVLGSHLFGIALGGCALLIGGFFDDRFSLKPVFQIIAPALAVGLVITSGIGVSEMSNPFGSGTIILGKWSDAVTAIWLFGMMYTTKFLDGLDGLVSGMTVIGAAVIGSLSIFFFVNIPTASIAFTIAGAFLGFLVLNFHPAKLFLGEGGSVLAGFLLGILSLLSGAKFATALLVLGIPILDAVWVVIRRTIIEKRSPFVGDRRHLHFRLLDAGLSHTSAVLLLYAVSAVFGLAALFLQTSAKIVALLCLAALMGALALVLARTERKNELK